MTKLNLSPEIIKTRERPETWRVEAINDQTGDVYCAEFWGPNARQMAEEYALAKFQLERVPVGV